MSAGHVPIRWTSLYEEDWWGHGLLARYVKLRVAHASGMPGTFSPPSRVSDPGMHHGTCVTHEPGCMLWSLTSSYLWSRNFTYLVKRPMVNEWFRWISDNVMGPLLPTEISEISIGIIFHIKQTDLIIHPCLNFNGGLGKPASKIGRGWIFASHINFLSLPQSPLYMLVKGVHGLMLPRTDGI